MKPSQIFLAIILPFSSGAITAEAQQHESTFYRTREPKSVRSFLAHADKVDIVSPNWYSVDASGLLSARPNPEVLETARQRQVRGMPAVGQGGLWQARDH